MRPITVTLDFTFDWKVDGFTIVPDMECRAEAQVRPGEPARPYQDDPGSGPEVEYFDCIEIVGENYDTGAVAYVTPPPDLYRAILAYLESGAEDARFAEAALDAGREDPDYRRDLLAGE